MAVRSITEHLGHLPLFPLPDALLFPSTRMPLHIFEQRYRQLVQDARRDGLPIAIGHIKKSSEPGDVAVHSVVGAGYIDAIEELPDGRFMIVLLGVERVSIVSEVETEHPYRVVIGQRLLDTGSSSEQNQRAIEAARRTILAIHYIEPRVASSLTAAITGRTRAGEVADILASLLHTDPEVRQCWLEETDPVARLKSVTQELETYLARCNQGRSTAN